MTFVVEKHYAQDRYGFKPEVRECDDFPSLKAVWEDLAERGPFEAHEEAGRLKRGEVEELREVDPESGDEVLARRA